MFKSEAIKILVVSPEALMRNLIRDALKEEIHPVSTVSLSKSALRQIKKSNFEILILDMKLAYKHCQKQIEEIKSINPEILITAIINTSSFDVIRQILKLGIYGYLINPFNLEELVFIIKKAVKFINLASDNKNLFEELGESRARLEKHAIELEKEGTERVHTIDKLYKDLQDTYMRTIKTLIQAIDAKDHYTHSHSENVMRYATAIAKELKLNHKEIEQIREACALHDLGKIAIQDHILTKPGKLTKEEWSLMKLHSSKGAEILSPLGFLDGVIDLIRQHHERFDGKGYPDGIKADKIPLGARIMSVADAYDAMISARPYRKRPLTKAEAALELKNNSGSQFDPKLIKVFLRIIHRD